MNRVTVGQLCEPGTGQIKLDSEALIDYFDIASVNSTSKSITEFTTYTFGEAPSRASILILYAPNTLMKNILLRLYRDLIIE